MIECRVFKSTVMWADVIFYFPTNISFKEIKRNLSSSFLEKDDYKGSFTFEEKYLNLLDSNTMYDKIYFFTYYIPNGKK